MRLMQFARRRWRLGPEDWSLLDRRLYLSGHDDPVRIAFALTSAVALRLGILVLLLKPVIFLDTTNETITTRK